MRSPRTVAANPHEAELIAEIELLESLFDAERKKVRILNNALLEIIESENALSIRSYGLGDIATAALQAAIAVTPASPDPVICKACGCKVDKNGCGCNPADA